MMKLSTSELDLSRLIHWGWIAASACFAGGVATLDMERELPGGKQILRVFSGLPGRPEPVGWELVLFQAAKDTIDRGITDTRNKRVKIDYDDYLEKILPF